MRRFHRFSVRALLAITFLSAAYFACGPSTRKRGVEDVQAFLDQHGDYHFNVEYRAPLLLSGSMDKVGFTSNALPKRTTVRDYYVWCFGSVFKLYRRESSVDDPSVYDRGIPRSPAIELRPPGVR